MINQFMMAWPLWGMVPNDQSVHDGMAIWGMVPNDQSVHDGMAIWGMDSS